MRSCHVLRSAPLLALGVGLTALAAALPGTPAAVAQPQQAPSCTLDHQRGTIQHVIYLQFDNVHFSRDNPNVPSDLEQMPHLLAFMEQRGALLTNHHTPLIAHTATDILTAETGVYPDRHGVAISNSFRAFNPDGSSSSVGAFGYWTDPLSAADTSPLMLSAANTNAPAPWVPFTRAGCNVGAAGLANIDLENNKADITTVFGANSPEAAEAKANPVLATTDFVGIAVHCAQNDPLCAAANNGRPDLLPQEPGTYTDFSALYGHKYVAPQISPSGPLTDLSGNVIKDSSGNAGFPGFDGMSAGVTLAYIAAMQEHGVPVTYGYISDAHDNHQTGGAYGPGEAGYVTALKAYDDAFAAFFARLKQDGIDQRNTLFVVTADEGDHFVGGPPSPQGCNGVTTPCTYSQIGEINGNLAGLLATQQNVTTPFAVHADAAPNFYLTGNPAQDSPITRAFERAVAALHGVNPYTGQDEPLTHFLADQAEMKLLHMITADPRRTPTFTMFAKPDYFLFAAAPNCSQPCLQVQAGFAWNHGDVAPDINRTWLGIVGPGVWQLGQTDAIWSDHTDIRPTMLALLGLKDDYRSDGRVLIEAIHDNAKTPVMRHAEGTYTALARVYKRINAAVGPLALNSLAISTAAIASNDPQDATYLQLEQQIAGFTQRRDALAGQMAALLDAAAFHDQDIPDDQANRLIAQARELLEDVRDAVPGD